jgi:hypothetical protein
MKILRLTLAVGLACTLVSLPASAHCVKRNGVVIDPSFVVPGTVAGGGVDVGHLACPAANVSLHQIPPGANAIVVVFVFDHIVIGHPAEGTVTIKGLGGDRVIKISFGIFDGPDNQGVFRLRSWPINISPLKKGSASVFLQHGTATYTTTYTRTVGT